MSITILDIISPGLKEEFDLKPLELNEVVEFRLTNAGVVDPSSTKKTATPAFTSLAGQDDILDPFDKKATKKRIMNIVGYEPIKEVGKPTYMDPIIESVKFDSSGSIYCTAGQENLLYFMKLMNKNGTNPNRIPTKPIKFVEVDDKKEITIKNNIFEYRAMASLIIMNNDDDDEALIDIAQKIERAYPSQYKYNLSDINALKANLAALAEASPIDFIKGVKEEKTYARLIVDDAIARRKIFFNEHPEHMSWHFKRTGAQKKSDFITKLETDKNVNKRLVEFLLTADGSKHLVELRQAFEDFYQKPR